MIIDLPRFIATERPAWAELESMLDELGQNPNRQLALEEARRFHFLYQKASADLGRVATFASEPELKRYLESLVARAYAEIHETRERGVRWNPLRWFFVEFPAAFRRRFAAFGVALLIALAGTAFGAFALLLDEEAKSALVPSQFEHVLKDPAQRVAEEEAASDDPAANKHATFAAYLMQNNITVSIRAMALGMTFGIGTAIEVFRNFVLVGMISADFIGAGYVLFLVGWLLPHGSFELPAILIAAQGGFVLGGALIGRGSRAPLAARLRAVGPDVATIIGGVAVMLIWAGVVESYFSQHHQPRIPYWLKISVGVVETVALTAFLSSAWWRKPRPEVKA
jgi:uncharacterized membrane protein SpoIIM required for sporulation